MRFCNEDLPTVHALLHTVELLMRFSEKYKCSCIGVKLKLTFKTLFSLSVSGVLPLIYTSAWWTAEV